MLVLEDGLVLGEDQQLVGLDVGVGAGVIDDAHVVVGPHRLRGHGLHPDGADVLRGGVGEAVVEEHHTVGVRHPVAVAHHHRGVEVGPHPGHPHVALGRVDLAVADLDVVVDHLGVGEHAQRALVHIGEVGQVQEVLHRTGRGRGHPDGARVHVAPPGMVVLRQREQVGGGIAEAGPEIAVLGLGRQGLGGVEAGQVDRGSGGHLRRRSPHPALAVAGGREADPFLEQQGLVHNADADLVEGADHVPLVDDHRVGAGRPRHLHCVVPALITAAYQSGIRGEETQYDALRQILLAAGERGSEGRHDLRRAHDPVEVEAGHRAAPRCAGAPPR